MWGQAGLLSSLGRWESEAQEAKWLAQGYPGSLLRGRELNPGLSNPRLVQQTKKKHCTILPLYERNLGSSFRWKKHFYFYSSNLCGCHLWQYRWIEACYGAWAMFQSWRPCQWNENKEAALCCSAHFPICYRTEQQSCWRKMLGWVLCCLDGREIRDDWVKNQGKRCTEIRG